MEINCDTYKSSLQPLNIGHFHWMVMLCGHFALLLQDSFAVNKYTKQTLTY